VENELSNDEIKNIFPWLGADFTLFLQSNMRRYKNELE